jgi:hypothetical protein
MLGDNKPTFLKGGFVGGDNAKLVSQHDNKIRILWDELSGIPLSVNS